MSIPLADLNTPKDQIGALVSIGYSTNQVDHTIHLVVHLKHRYEAWRRDQRDLTALINGPRGSGLPLTDQVRALWSSGHVRIRPG